MRKILKLIGLIAIVVCIIVGVMVIPRIIDDIGSPTTKSDYDKLSNKVSQRWEQSNATWSMDDYMRLVADIDVNKKNLNNDKHNTLRELNAVSATKVLCTVMMKAFEDNSPKNKIDELNKDVKKLKEDPYQMKDNSSIKECEETYSLYTRILNYGKQTFNFSPDFNVDTGRFTTFAEHKEKKDQTENFKNNQYYSKIKNRTDVKEAFNNVERELNKEKNAYPQKVAEAIKVAFNQREYTQANLDLLNNACVNFSDEYHGNTALVGYLKDFKDKVSGGL